ncbi:histidine kinase [Pacificimonas flava]|uniref:histidine kinase n=2 Tax=Pacificimonas TaxID=1960290 RepID=A0A219B2U9_9SPHN|nr:MULTISPECIES: ActS/PrrB/RegB family redox-sensitive histidine kinase [Pacificimonas]MBZ6377643.1 ActS/PrrB/RegB family redox-sensitive histidine kinase [Pacificimonas aurantium]OWV32670.1 histidine kinase [Pacificimonas flava]
MTSASPQIPAALGQPGVRVRTLVLIRWLAIGGQSLTFLVVGLGLGFSFPYFGVACALLSAVLLNLGLVYLYPRTARLVGTEALLHLAFDLVQLGVLLFLTGGINNPFVVLAIVPVTVSATLLTRRATVTLMAVAIAILLILWAWAEPLPWDGEPPAMPVTYEVAVFASLAFSIIFISGYVMQVALEARRWQQALVTTQAVLERETKMSALGALAAAAAHELGGPLGTIKLIATDLKSELEGDPDFGADVELLAKEADRCRSILQGIASRSEREAPFERVSIRTLLREIADSFNDPRVPIRVAEAAQGLPVIEHSTELKHGLLNLVDNAVRFADREVVLAATADTDQVAIYVEDDGPGFPSDLLPHLGEPYLGPSRSRGGGTGLGVFIATTLLERTGARVRFRNRTRGGARVEITWHQNPEEDDL